MQTAAFPILLFAGCAFALALVLLVLGSLLGPRRAGRVKQMPYESGMDPVHDTRRRFDVRFHLLAIAFLVFDVELLFLYPWAVAVSPAQAASYEPGAIGTGDSTSPGAQHRGPTAVGRPELGASPSRQVFVAGLVFLGILALGYIYDWRKGVFAWR